MYKNGQLAVELMSEHALWKRLRSNLIYLDPTSATVLHPKRRAVLVKECLFIARELEDRAHVMTLAAERVFGPELRER